MNGLLYNRKYDEMRDASCLVLCISQPVWVALC